MPTPKDQARENIAYLLTQAAWAVRNQNDANILAYRGVEIRNFTLESGHGFPDYLFYAEGMAAGVIEAKKEGVTLTGVETQSDKHLKGLPDGLPAWSKPRPFSYQSTGVEGERRVPINEELTSEVEVNLKRAERLRQSIPLRVFTGKLRSRTER